MLEFIDLIYVSDHTLFLSWKYYLLSFLHFLKLSCTASRLADWLKLKSSVRSRNPCSSCISARSLHSKLCVRSAANRETAFPHSQRSKRWKLYYSLRTTIKRIRLRSAAHHSAKDLLDSGSRGIDGKWMPEAARGYLIFGYRADRVVEVTEWNGWKSKRRLLIDWFWFSSLCSRGSFYRMHVSEQSQIALLYCD